MTTKDQPSIHLQYDIPITIGESTFDMSVRGLATAELFSVRLDSVRLGPDATLVCNPNIFLDSQHANPNAVVQPTIPTYEPCLYPSLSLHGLDYHG